MAVDGLISKIEALFKQAANTPYPDEAATFQAKAQELMTKYQIEEAMLNNRVLDDELTTFDVMINNPYLVDKAILLNAVAQNNYCKVVRHPKFARVYGYSNDIRMVVAMYTALEIDMINQMWVAFKDKTEYTSTVSWKKSFFGGYANRIHHRLKTAKKEQFDETSKNNGNDEFALVLVKKDKSVEDYYNSNTFALRTTTRTLTSASGYGAGSSAGNRADIGQSRIGGRAALSR